MRKTTFRHSGNAGDIIYALPTIAAMTRSSPATLLLEPNVNVGKIPNGWVHPHGNVRLTPAFIAMLKPLLESQPYIERVDTYRPGDAIDHDLDVFRDRLREMKKQAAMVNLAISHAIAMNIKDQVNIRRPWLSLTPPDQQNIITSPVARELEMCGIRPYRSVDANTILVNRTVRYHQWDPEDYAILKQTGCRLVFVGLYDEYQTLRHEAGLDAMEHVLPEDFNELAHMIGACRFLVGNQSLAYAIAEGMGHPRIQETHIKSPNCKPYTPNGFSATRRSTLFSAVTAQMDATEPRARQYCKTIGKPAPVTVNAESFHDYGHDFYPDYLNHGNARAHIMRIADQYCVGDQALDIGCSQWPYPGARGIDDQPGLNAYELDSVEDNSQDFIFSSHCLEHLENWQDALNLWVTKLKPGGVLFLYLPHESMALWRRGGPWVGHAHKWVPDVKLVSQGLTDAGAPPCLVRPGPDAYRSFCVVGRKPPLTAENEKSPAH